MDIIEMDLSELIPADYNPNFMDDDELKKLDRSLTEFGFVDPIIYHVPTKMIIGGHQRQITNYVKGKKRGFSLILGDIGWFFTDQEIKLKDDNKIKALNLALNKIKGQFDQVKLESLFHDLKLEGFDTTLTGFDNLELQELETNIANKTEVIEDDFDPETVEESIVQPGEIYQLGIHRLMCGDSTKQEDFKKLMNGKQADMIFTDPPYGLGGYGGRKNLELKGDRNNNIKEFYDCIPKNIPERYIWGNYINLMRDIDDIPRDVIVWKKNNFGLGKGYRGQYELCFYFGNFNGSDSDVWEVKKEINYIHPTQKPVELPARAITNSSLKNDIILDLFGGSGSTLIAAEQLERQCYMMELDPHYCDVIINRWEQFTERKAEIINY